MKDSPRILVFDIELLPIEAYVWSPWDQNISPNQIKQDWTVASYAAKWLGKKEIFYADNRKSKNVRDDRKLLKGIWLLLDDADIVVTQNGKQFDEKKLNSRFLINDIGEPAPFKHADTRQMAKRRFGFTYNSLEYLCDALKVKFKKLKSKKFIGQDLWTQCLAGSVAAWKEMERYNKRDVQATECIFEKLRPWGMPGIDLNVFRSGFDFRCQCGSSDLVRRGTYKTKTGEWRQYRCNNCRAWPRESGAKNNLLGETKRESLRGKSGR